MEAPFRFPITGLADIERLMDVLEKSQHLIPGSLKFAEGRELLEEQLTSEGRANILMPELTSNDFRNLMRILWQQPLQSKHPRFLRFNANLTSDPNIEFSMRIDVPTTEDLPRWVDLEGSRDPAVLTHLRTVYQEIARESQLRLLEV